MKELKYLDITKTNQGHIKVPSVEGMYPDMGAGRAEAIVTNIHDTDLTPYVFRKTPFRSTRETEKMIGVSVPWNQLAKNDNTSGSASSITFTNNGDGTWSVTGLASANAYRTVNATNYPMLNGHKYLFCGCPAGGSNETYRLGLMKGGSTVRSERGNGAIYAATEDNTLNLVMYIYSGYDANLKYTPQLFDLTLALGSSIADYIYTLETNTEGAGVAKLREWGFFDKPYYAYNAGGIESVNVSKHRMVGLNQWDEETESGYINANGSFSADANSLRSKNYCECLPNTSYYLRRPTTYTNQIGMCWYDANKTFISRAFSTTAVTSPANAAYFKVSLYGYGATYKNDICINLSNHAVNGTYEPYTVHEYPLADVTLRGILKLDGSNNLYADGDVYESDGTVTRKYGIVDLGTLDWVYDYSVFYATITDKASAGNNNMICPRFTVAGTKRTDITADLQMAPFNASTSKAVAIRYDAANQDAAAFTTAMNGVYLVYELDTPTTETADPYTNPQVCSPYGTEEYVDRAVAAGTRDVSIPVGHSTEYAKDIVGAIEGIPFPPTTNGNYKLRVSVASGVPTYSWVSE